MSNLVVWNILGTLILQVLDSMGDPVETISVERQRENHPLIHYLDLRLSQALGVQGSARCPELEKKIIELKNRDPSAISKLVRKIIKDYYSERRNKFYPKADSETIITV
ncbi:MAG: hypothetical protein J7K82_08585 [Thermoproteales archaeon]|nr:hypothetical protein [Thermoproteales archaeon]